MIDNNYANYLMKYKEKLWEKCINSKVFDNIPKEYLDNVQKIFENNIENFKTQIIQENGDNDNIDKIIINNINIELQNLKILTKEQITEKKQSLLNNSYEKKIKEFNTLVNNNVPENIDFEDNTKDEPIENFENLIENRLNERKQLIEDYKNEDISNSNFIVKEQTITNNIYSQNNDLILNTINDETVKTNNEILENQKKIIKTLNTHTDILNKILKSQIFILENIKQ